MRFFRYFAVSQNGALAIVKSFERSMPVRVFRSTACDGPFRAISNKNVKTRQYRYDGLYIISNWFTEERVHPSTNEKTTEYYFDFQRLKVGPSKYDNELDVIDLLQRCLAQKTMLPGSSMEMIISCEKKWNYGKDEKQYRMLCYAFSSNGSKKCQISSSDGSGTGYETVAC